MTGWPFDPLRPLSAGCILADPPWRYAMRSDKGRGRSPDAHYACMSLAAIQALPVGQLAQRDCALMLWLPRPFVPQALAVMGAWGFDFRTALTWGKRSRTGRCQAFGTGYIVRDSSELLFVGVLGRPEIRSRSVRSHIEAPIRKPDEIYGICEALWRGPHVELFSRTDRAGWASWGDEAGRFGEAP